MVDRSRLEGDHVKKLCNLYCTNISSVCVRGVFNAWSVWNNVNLCFFPPHTITKVPVRASDVQVISTLVLKVQLSLSGILTVIPQNLDVFRDGDNSVSLFQV